jgi:lysozyme
MIERAFDLARMFEGCRLRAYQDPIGIWTIGYGHTPAQQGQQIDQAEADALLATDMNKAASAALRLCPVLATRENALAAVSDFVFNLGAGRLQASTLRRRINQSEWDLAAGEFGKWVYAGGRVLKGLVARREAERAVFLLE